MNRLVVLAALFFFLPLFGLLIPFGDFSNFFGPNPEDALSTIEHLWNFVLGSYITSTIILVIGVGIGVVVLGVGNAFLIAHYQFPGKRIFEWALILPLAVPTYVMAYLFVDLLQFSGPIQQLLRSVLQVDRLPFFPDPRSLGGAIWSFSLCLYPYVYLITRTAFLERSAHLSEVAQTLGYSAMDSFFKLLLPMARPAIFAGTALALMEVLADYGAVSYFGIQTFATGIFKAWLSLGDRLAAVQLALGLLTIVLFIFYIEKRSRAQLRYASTSTTSRGASSSKLSGEKAFLAFIFCATTLFIAFVMPICALVLFLLKEGAQWDVRYLTWLSNSFTLAIATAFISVICAVFFAYAARLSPGIAWINRLLGFGYALPGTVLAVGILSFLGYFDLGWIMSSSIWILIYAYLIRFLSSGLQSIDTGLTRIAPTLDATASLLGLTIYQTLRRIHLPLLSRSIFTAGLLVFVDVMKELPATLLLRPFNFDTLAVATYQLAADERLSELALPALTIVLVGLIPVFVLARVIASNKSY